MIADYPDVPPRLTPLLAQWDHVAGQLLNRLDGLTDDALNRAPAGTVLTVRRGDDGRPAPDQFALGLDPVAVPPRTLAWSIGHLGSLSPIRVSRALYVGAGFRPEVALRNYFKLDRAAAGDSWTVTADRSLDGVHSGRA